MGRRVLIDAAAPQDFEETGTRHLIFSTPERSQTACES